MQVGLLQRFEDSLDRVVNGAFAKAFKAEVQPVELAAALQREVDDRASVLDRNRTVIPNIFHIELSEHDYTRLAVFREALAEELANLVSAYGSEQDYTLLGSVRISFGQDGSLETGIFRVRSEARAEVTSRVVKAEPIVADPLAAGPPFAPHPQRQYETQQNRHSSSGGQPRLEVGGDSHPLVRAITLIGRGADADVRVQDPGVSRQHCEIVVGRPAVVRDLQSTNGTYVDGSRISEVELEDGSVIRIGGTSLVFRSG